MSKAHLFVFLVVLLFGVHLVYPEEFKYQRGDWKINRISCGNSSGCRTYYCNVKLKSAHVQLFSAGCDFIRDQNHARARLKLFYKSSTRYLPFLIDIDLDYCSFMASNSKDRNPMAAALLPMFTKYSNINHTCPLTGMMYMKEARLDRSLVMGFKMPAGKFRIDFQMYDKETPVFVIQIWYTVFP